jgi:acyl-homoserine lactone acylase PvdQ
MHRSLVLFSMVTVVALIAVASTPASQQASAHQVHTASTQVSTTAAHHKAHTVLVDPQAHGIPLLNATAFKKELTKEVKGPYGESDVIGGVMSGGY